MNTTMWKYTLRPISYQVISLPGEDAKVVHVGIQNGEICVWALCDPAGKPTYHNITICGTGHMLPVGVGDYVGSFQRVMDSNPEFVGHVFTKKS